ncbi:MAG: ATPase [Actinobacteria bacterium]|nr:ATPase [Actinomycetota bacterium]NBT48168.1 ATPase [Actinomycetota bacterium]
MSTLSDLMKKLGQTHSADVEWLHLLVADWQIIADLSFADLVLWLPDQDGNFTAAGHARPSSAATLFYRDITGRVSEPAWLKVIEKAFSSGQIVEEEVSDIFQGVPEQISAIPVFRKLNAKTGSDKSPSPIAVITKHTNLSEVSAPNKTRTNLTQLGDNVLRMVTDGSYPVFSIQAPPRRGTPRVNDGLLHLDADGGVVFSSPNGISAFQKLGVDGELEGRSLKEITDELNKGSWNVDENLPKIVDGKMAWRADIEGNSSALSVRAIPISDKGKHIGAILLCRDVTELRRQERELVTKDATIREIHHRVKNNLQTVASLLRIQGRRSKSSETLEALSDAERRVAAIAVVHDSLSEGLAQDVNFDEVYERIEVMVGELAAAFNAKVTNLKIGKFGRLPSEIATPLAVVLTELVTNAYEHGLTNRTGHLTVSATRRSKKLLIKVSDDGIGLDQGKPLNGLGTQLVRTLVESELRGKIEFHSEKTGGTTVSLEVSLA